MTQSIENISSKVDTLNDTPHGVSCSISPSDKARIIPHKRDGDFVVFNLPGFHSDGEVISELFDPYIEDLGSAYYLVHPEEGFSLESTRDAILRARAGDPDRPAIINAASMGGLLACDLLSDPEFVDEMGEVEVVAFDSPLSKPGDLSASTTVAVIGGSVLPITRRTKQFYRSVMMKDTQGYIDRDPAVPHENALRHVVSSALTSLSAGKGQMRYIRRTSVARMNLEYAASRVRNWRTISAIGDRIINQAMAYTTMNQKLDGRLERFVDFSRKPGCHASGIERPQSTRDMMLGRNLFKYSLLNDQLRLAV